MSCFTDFKNLKIKIENLKFYKDKVNSSLEEDLYYLEKLKKEKDLKMKKRNFIFKILKEKEANLKNLEKIGYESEKSLKKIITTSEKLNFCLEQELN